MQEKVLGKQDKEALEKASQKRERKNLKRKNNLLRRKEKNE